ncbi:MAG TPA: PAC2 family protein [Actinomycetota bacterium]|nr:PAC2 family protein [Actinomycetota bacterium]
MTDSELHIDLDIELRNPVVVAAFRGWNDAGDAASFAAQHLGRSWRSKKFAWIDPEEFFDFQSVRPQVKLIDGVTRQISWPSNEFFAARLDGAPHDIMVLVGTEPNLRWRRFAGLVADVAKSHGASLVITLGALLADVPHSRPTQITGTAISSELVNRLGLKRSRYEGPTGIVGVLHDACGKAGIDSASLWAAVPHYLAVNPNPKAALALVEKTVGLVGAPVAIDELARATSTYEEQVSEMVASDEDVQAYVRLLEQRADEGDEELDPSNLPTGDALADELERFLRERGEGPGIE